MDNYHPYRETAKHTPLFFIWILLAVLGAMLATGAWLTYERHYQNQQTNITRQTNQYRTSTQQHLIVLMASYGDLDAKAGQYAGSPAAVQGFRDQQRAIVLEMRQQAATMEPADVPPEVRQFLATH
jgi:hypothetical protein